MEAIEDMTGALVLVHPELSEDPVNKQGQVGTITFSDPLNDEFFVSFGKETALYSSDALLAFKKPNAIYDDLLANIKNMDKQEIKDLYRIGMLLDSRQPKDQKLAMDMVLANPKIREYTLVSLKEKLGPIIGAEATYDMSASRGR